MVEAAVAQVMSPPAKAHRPMEIYDQSMESGFVRRPRIE